MAGEMSATPGKKPITREQAITLAKDCLRQQPSADEFEEASARVIESNECINVLFRYIQPHQPQEGMVSVEKLGGTAKWIKLN